VLYMLNQLGGSVGVAVVALILETSADPVAGLHGVSWFAVGVLLLLLVAATRLPGRVPPASDGPRGRTAQAEKVRGA